MLAIPTTVMLLPILLLTSQLAYAGKYNAVAEPICDDNLFGSPNPDDCDTAMRWIPYADGSFLSRAGKFQVFSEPRFTGFESVENKKYRPRAIVQLPKVWYVNVVSMCLFLIPD